MDLQSELARFGYTSAWLELGLLTEADLLSQIAQQHAEADPNYEHFRYRSFRAWLGNRSGASDEDVTGFIRIALADPDRAMAGSALADLLDTAWLTDGQFEAALVAFPTFGEWTVKRIVRASLRRELAANPWSDSLFEKCLAQNDRAVHLWLFGIPGLTRLEMEALALKGCNKAIRNQAVAALKGRKWKLG